MNTPNNRIILSSGFFIVTLMLLDATLNDEFDKIPREVIGGIVLVLMLSTFEFIGLAKIAGPFAALIAGTVFLSRGGRIFTRLAQLSDTASAEQQDSSGFVPGYNGTGTQHVPEHQQGG